MCRQGTKTTLKRIYANKMLNLNLAKPITHKARPVKFKFDSQRISFEFDSIVSVVVFFCCFKENA